MSVGDLYVGLTRQRRERAQCLVGSDAERTGEIAVTPRPMKRRRAVQQHAARPIIARVDEHAPPRPENADGRAQTSDHAAVPITVLTIDVALPDAIRAAVVSRHPVSVAACLDEAVELAAAGRCCILITDQVSTQPALRQATRRLREKEPALVVIAVGNSGDQNALIGLLSAGVVDRLMLKPVTPALAQIVLKSATQQHRTLKFVAASEPRAIASEQQSVSEPEPEPHGQEPQPETAVTLVDTRGERKQKGPTPVVVVDAQREQEPSTAVVLVNARRDEPETALVFVEVQRHVPDELAEARLDLQPASTDVVLASSMASAAVASKRIAISRPPWTAVVAALAVVAGLMWWVASQRESDIDPRAAIPTNLAAAQRAFQDGHALEPRGRSAIDYYNTVLALDPANAAAKQGIDQIADRFAAQAGLAIARGQVAAAIVALEGIRRVQPEHGQLAALETQLVAAQEHYVSLLQPREAAAAQLQRQQAIEPASPASIVPQADAATADHKSTLDSRARVLAQANEALKRDQLDTASALIGEARSLGVPSAELNVLNQALVTAQQGHVKDDLLQRVLRRTAENRLLEPAEDSAKHYLQRLVQLDGQFVGVEQGIAALGGRLTANAQLATAEKNFDLAANLLLQAREIGFTGADLEAAQARLASARKPAEPSADTAPGLKLSRVVRPEYPQEALLSGAEGWVDVSLSVTPTGNVLDPRVEESSNGRLFDRAALAAVRKWKYEPYAASDHGATQRTLVRVDFRRKDRRDR